MEVHEELLGEQSGVVVEALPLESALGETDVVSARLRALSAASLDIPRVKEAFLPARRADGIDVSMVMEAHQLDCGVDVFSEAPVETDAWPKSGMCTDPCLVAGRVGDSDVSPDQ